MVEPRWSWRTWPHVLQYIDERNLWFEECNALRGALRGTPLSEEEGVRELYRDGVLPARGMLPSTIIRLLGDRVPELVRFCFSFSLEVCSD